MRRAAELATGTPSPDDEPLEVTTSNAGLKRMYAGLHIAAIGQDGLSQVVLHVLETRPRRADRAGGAEELAAQIRPVDASVGELAVEAGLDADGILAEHRNGDVKLERHRGSAGKVTSAPADAT